jgi:hypothetical protein
MSFMAEKISRCTGIMYEPMKKRQIRPKSIQTVVLRERKKFFIQLITRGREHGTKREADAYPECRYAMLLALCSMRLYF